MTKVTSSAHRLNTALLCSLYVCYSEYCVECACSKVQCPVKKSSRKYKKNVALESGSNGHVQTPQSSRKAVTTENKQSLDSKLKVQIPAPINGVHETKVSLYYHY